MPERLDRVAILLSGGPVVISWDDREELLLRMESDVEVGRRLHSQFTAVGATREVAPDLDEKQYLRHLLGGPQPPASTCFATRSTTTCTTPTTGEPASSRAERIAKREHLKSRATGVPSMHEAIPLALLLGVANRSPVGIHC